MSSANKPFPSESEDPAFFTTILKDHPIKTYPLTNVVLLTGQANYETWFIFMMTIWRTNGMAELVVDGQKPSSKADKEEHRSYTLLYNAAMGILLQVISSDLLKVVLEYSDPYLMWWYLVTEYKRDSAFALVYQVGTLCQLVNAYRTVKNLSEYIQLFESEWNKLYRLAKDSSGEYQQDFAKFLQKDLAKRDFLLGFLSRHKKNAVDNLTTKSNLTFATVKQHLDIDYEETSETAPVTGSVKLKKLVLSRPSGESKSYNNVFSYCKKHYPKANHNHHWYNCLRLKEDKKKNRIASNNRNAQNVHTEAMMTASEENDSMTSLHVPAL